MRLCTICLTHSLNTEFRPKLIRFIPLAPCPWWGSSPSQWHSCWRGPRRLWGSSWGPPCCRAPWWRAPWRPPGSLQAQSSYPDLGPYQCVHPHYVCNVQTVVSKAWTAEAARSSARGARVVMVSRAHCTALVTTLVTLQARVTRVTMVTSPQLVVRILITPAVTRGRYSEYSCRCWHTQQLVMAEIFLPSDIDYIFFILILAWYDEIRMNEESSSCWPLCFWDENWTNIWFISGKYIYKGIWQYKIEYLQDDIYIDVRNCNEICRITHQFGKLSN